LILADSSSSNSSNNNHHHNVDDNDGSHDDFYIARLNISHGSACMIIPKKIAFRYDLYQKRNALIIPTDGGILIKRLKLSDTGFFKRKRNKTRELPLDLSRGFLTHPLNLQITFDRSVLVQSPKA
jgi:hypothetical protein